MVDRIFEGSISTVQLTDFHLKSKDDCLVLGRVGISSLLKESDSAPHIGKLAIDVVLNPLVVFSHLFHGNCSHGFDLDYSGSELVDVDAGCLSRGHDSVDYRVVFNFLEFYFGTRQFIEDKLPLHF